MNITIIVGIFKENNSLIEETYIFNFLCHFENLFNVKAISKVYRAKFVSEMRKVLPNQGQELYDKLFSKNWVVYAKRPFGKPENIVEYFGRYSHKIAISNFRILAINDEKRTVTFSLKDYRKGGQKKILTLQIKEFIKV